MRKHVQTEVRGTDLVRAVDSTEELAITNIRRLGVDRLVRGTHCVQGDLRLPQRHGKRYQLRKETAFEVRRIGRECLVGKHRPARSKPYDDDSPGNVHLFSRKFRQSVDGFYESLVLAYQFLLGLRTRTAHSAESIGRRRCIPVILLRDATAGAKIL